MSRIDLLTSSIGALVLTTAVHAQDDCSTAVPIAGLGTFPYTTVGMTSSGFFDELCYGSNRDSFFQWTATTSGYVQFDTCLLAETMGIDVYAGVGCAAVCTAHGDPAACATPGARSVVIGPVAPGDQFLVQVGTLGAAPNPLPSSSLTVSVAPGPPAHDTCASPQAIAGTGSFAYDRTLALDSGFDGGNGSVCYEYTQRDLFFAWTAQVAGAYAFSLCSDPASATLSVHVGSDCSAVCSSYHRSGICPINFRGEWRVADIQVGDTFLFQVGDRQVLPSGSGPGSLDITLLPPPPAQDDCAAPTVIQGEGSFPFDRTLALTSNFDGGSIECARGAGFPVTLDVPLRFDTFFVWSTATAGAYRFNVSSTSGADTLLNVHLGNDCSAVCLNDAAGTAVVSPDEMQVEVPFVVAGADYLIQVGQLLDHQSPGAGVVDVTSYAQPPIHNECGSATVVTSLGSLAWDNSTATTSGFHGGGQPCFGGTSQHAVFQDLFYAWTAATAGDYVIETFGSGAPTRMQIHEGAGCSAECLLREWESNQIGESRVQLRSVQVGETFLIQVGGDSGAALTSGVLRIDFAVSSMSNQDCSTATPIVGEATVPIDTLAVGSSGFNGGSFVDCGPSYSHTDCGGIFYECTDFEGAPPHSDVFYQWTPLCSGTYSITACAEDNIHVDMNVHQGVGCAATCLGSHTTFTGVCPNSTSYVFQATAGADYLVQVGMWSPQSVALMDLTFARAGGPCGTGSLGLTCDPASAHYLGGTVTLGTSAFGSGVGSDLHVEATGGPPGEYGFFIVAPTATSNIPIFNGVLCLDAPVARFDNQVATNQGLPQLDSIGRFDASGVLENLAGTSTSGFGFDFPNELPYTPAGLLVQPGDTWCIQLWYRDQNPPLPNPGSAANFSNVLVATFP